MIVAIYARQLLGDPAHEDADSGERDSRDRRPGRRGGRRAFLRGHRHATTSGVRVGFLRQVPPSWHGSEPERFIKSCIMTRAGLR